MHELVEKPQKIPVVFLGKENLLAIVPTIKNVVIPVAKNWCNDFNCWHIPNIQKMNR